jgi:hypothetical protein
MHKMFRLIIILCLAVIGIVFIGCTIGSIGKQAQICKIHIGNALDLFAVLGKGQKVSLAHKEHHFIQLHRNVMMACWQHTGFDAVAFAVLYPHLQHLLRQINITTSGILLIYRGDQQAFTDHHLILYLAGKVILREGERQRHTVHAVVQSSFHVLAVNVGQQQVAQL